VVLVLHRFLSVHYRGEGRLDFVHNFMYVNAMWTMEAYPDTFRSPKAFPLSWRLISLTGMMGYFILATGYSGGLFSFMSVPAFGPNLNSLKDIAEVKLTLTL